MKGGFKPVVLKPGETTALVELRLRTEEKEAMESRILDSVITLHTNISSIDLPLVCFHGKVKPVRHFGLGKYESSCVFHISVEQKCNYAFTERNVYSEPLYVAVIFTTFRHQLCFWAALCVLNRHL